MSIQTSIGTSTATSYVSVGSANTYFNSLEEAEKWTDMGSTSTLTKTTRKENLLKQATREIDRTYRFSGSKYYTGDIGASDYQSLEFPRSSNVDADNNLYIPDDIKYATYHQAYWILQRGTQRFSSDGTLVTPPLIGKEAYNYMAGWVNRVMKAVGNYGWKTGL
jgi:hypothetical protein